MRDLTPLAPSIDGGGWATLGSGHQTAELGDLCVSTDLRNGVVIDGGNHKKAPDTGDL